jgi:ATP-binding cassette, subfamily B, bacterial
MKQLLQTLISFRIRFYVASAYSVSNKVLDLMPPLLVGWLVDIVSGKTPAFIRSVTENDPWKGAIFIAVSIVAIFAVESLTEWLYQGSFLKIAQDVQHRLRTDTYSALQKKPISYFENNRTGNLLAILNDDINRLERFFLDVYNELLQVFVLVIFSAFAFFAVSWQLAVIGLLPVPFIIAGSILYQQWIGPYYKAIRDEAGRLNSRLENNLSGIHVIKSFVTEQFETDRVTAASDAYRKANHTAIRYMVLYTPVIRMFIAVGFAGVLMVASWWIIQGSDHVTLGQLALYGMLIQRLLWPLTRLGKVFDEYQKGVASMKRVFEVLETAAEPEKGLSMAPDLTKGLRFDNVHFQYQNDGQEVLANINLYIPAGKVTGIAGPTGAGKTSLIKLLLRFYEPAWGTILYDEYPMTQLSLSALRRNISLVSQDVYLFHGSIRENIAYGMSDASEEDIIAAAKKAAFHDFVISLPNTYDTVVGERGIKLSGGQRQRLSIARAILKNAPIIILDEATSAVDTETEKIIQENLHLLTAGKTAIIIAHRLSTLRHADNIIILEQGVVTEQGTHEQLIDLQGTYAQLWKIQTS